MSTIENTTMPVLNMEQATNLTLTALSARLPVLCHGSPGIGKSQGWAAQVAKHLNAPLHTFIPSHTDPVAINGLPAPDPDTNTTRTYMTQFFADIIRAATDNPDSNHLIFLDELGQASPAHQGPLMELVHERRVAGQQLPENVHIISATNKLDDGAMVQRMATPLRNRFIHFELAPDRTAWLNWLGTLPDTDTHPQIKSLFAGFLEFKPSNFYTFDPKAHTSYTFATPRSWAALARMLSRMLHAGAIATPFTDDHIRIIHTTALATVGEPVASDLSAFARTYTSLPSMTDIEEGRNPAVDTTDAAVAYALATALLERMTAHMKQTPTDAHTDTRQKIDNLFAYTVEHLHKDLQVWVAKRLFTLPVEIKRGELWTHWRSTSADAFINNNLDLLV